MKIKTKYLKRIFLQPKALFFAFLLLTMCIRISNVEQPETVGVGERVEVTIDVDVTPAESASYFMVLGVLAPESWDIGSNATVSYTSDNASGTMRLSTSSDPNYASQILDLAGIGENYGLVKWIVFISNTRIPATENVNFSGQIELSFDAGTENMKTQLGYLVGTSGWGITPGETSLRFTPCMEVTGGTNPVRDLCGPLPFPVTYQPAEFSYQDIIHINFDATKGASGGPTELIDAQEVYLCMKAKIDGESVEVCNSSGPLKMRSTGINKWRVSIWPQQIFNALPTDEITDITFSFVNQNGDIEVKNPDTGEDFELQANCSL